MNFSTNPMLRGTFCLASLFGLTLGFSMSVAPGLPGNLTIGEIFGLAIAPAGLLRFLRSRDDIERRFAKIVKLLIAISVLTLLLDIVVHGSREGDVVRSSATMAFATSNMLAVAWLLVKYSQTIPAFLLGLSIGRYLFTGQMEVGEHILANEYWDLRVGGWAGPLLLLGLLIGSYRSRTIAVAATTIYACAAIAYGGRSHGLVRLAAAASLYLPNNLASRVRNAAQSRATGLLIAGTIILPILSYGYVEVAKTGAINKKAKAQVESLDNPYNPIELIKSGRAGIFIGLEGVFNRPLAGYGSLLYASYYGDSHVVKSRGNYVHSVLLESMVYSGVAIGCLWIWLLWQQVQMSNLGDAWAWFREPSVELASSICLWSCVWVILFSPWVSLRLSWSIPCAIQFSLAVYAKEMQRRRSDDRFSVATAPGLHTSESRKQSQLESRPGLG